MGPLGRCGGTLYLSPKIQQQLQEVTGYIKKTGGNNHEMAHPLVADERDALQESLWAFDMR
jgi:hypothetical protein